MPSCGSGIVYFCLALFGVIAAGSHPKCEEISKYQASYVAKEYNRTKHLGHYYELAFRDLYLGPPYCDCQHTYKVPDAGGSYHENFEFQCQMLGRMATILNMNATESPSVFRQSFDWSNPMPPIPGIKQIGFETAVIAFKEIAGQDQYEWVLEFTCDRSDPLPLRLLFGGQTFVGINMYSRTGPTNQKNLDEMIAAAKELGLEWTLDNGWGWGFHIVSHNGTGKASCSYNPPTTQEYTCKKGLFSNSQCVPTRWGTGLPKDQCEATCTSQADSLVV